MTRRSSLMAGMIWLSLAAHAFAAGPLGVDVLTLKSGKSLRGGLLSRHADGSVLFAVSRHWLKQADAKEYEKQAARQATEQIAAWEEATSRLEKLLADPPDAPRLVFQLKQELQRIQKQLAAPQPVESPFLLLEIPATHVAKLIPAPPDRQRIGMWAWNEGLADVETRDAATLRKELLAAGVKVDDSLPDLSDQLPVRKQSDAEWSARLAILQYMLDEPLDFQGMGDTLVRTGGDEPVDLAAILPKLLTSQVDSLLGDLLNPGLGPKPQKQAAANSLQPAITVAEKNHQRSFRMTRLDVNPERRSATVQTEFVAKLGNGKWQTIWKHAETADGSKARPDAEAKIANDPQVKELLGSLKALGLGADGAVSDAIRFGAATMSAQQAADAKFFAFRDRYSNRVDGPPLPE